MWQYVELIVFDSLPYLLSMTLDRISCLDGRLRSSLQERLCHALRVIQSVTARTPSTGSRRGSPPRQGNGSQDGRARLRPAMMEASSMSFATCWRVSRFFVLSQSVITNPSKPSSLRRMSCISLRFAVSGELSVEPYAVMMVAQPASTAFLNGGRKTSRTLRSVTSESQASLAPTASP